MCASFICTQGCGCDEHPAFPAPSLIEGRCLCKTRARLRRGNAKACVNPPTRHIIRCAHDVPPSPRVPRGRDQAAAVSLIPPPRSVGRVGKRKRSRGGGICRGMTIFALPRTRAPLPLARRNIPCLPRPRRQAKKSSGKRKKEQYRRRQFDHQGQGLHCRDLRASDPACTRQIHQPAPCRGRQGRP